jgi:glucose/arabinose dehydrogenase
VVPHLPLGGHRTRDLAFSPDGATLYVSVGSGSNDADGMGPGIGALSGVNRALEAAWGNETDRADVLTFDPQGKDKRSSQPALATPSAWPWHRPGRCGA